MGMPRRITRAAAVNSIDSAASTVTIMRSHIKTTTNARAAARGADTSAKEDRP
jgi:hypothetical protein